MNNLLGEIFDKSETKRLSITRNSLGSYKVYADDLNSKGHKCFNRLPDHKELMRLIENYDELYVESEKKSLAEVKRILIHEQTNPRNDDDPWLYI